MIGFGLLLGLGLGTQSALATTTELISRNAFGAVGSNASDTASVSGDGRRVAFVSKAINLVRPDANGTARDIFVFERRTHKVSLVSVSSAGVQGNGETFTGTISEDGQSVAFESAASNLVPDDTNQQVDVFVRDLTHGTTERVGLTSDGRQIQKGANIAAISATGRFVVFSATGNGVVPGDTNTAPDVFVRDRQTGTTTLVSATPSGQAAAGQSVGIGVSADGRYVVFTSFASDIVPGDTNRRQDAFLRDMASRTTTRLSVGQGGVQADGGGSATAISSDGRHILFTAEATLLSGGRSRRTAAFMRDRVTGTTVNASLNSKGYDSNQGIVQAAMSPNGRFVAFDSTSTDVVPGDANGKNDVFLRDLKTGTTERVSLTASGGEARGSSLLAFNHGSPVSRDGRIVVFDSSADNLAPADPNFRQDVFARVR